MPFSEKEKQGFVKEPDNTGAVKEPAKKAASQKAPPAKKQAGKAAPEKTEKSARVVYHKSESAKPAAKTTRKATAKTGEKKPAEDKTAAAKIAAAAAREEAKAKRSRAARGGATGSIFAAAVAEGVQPAQPDDIADAPRATGSIFAASMREDVPAPQEDAAVFAPGPGEEMQADLAGASQETHAEAGQELAEMAQLLEETSLAVVAPEKAATGEVPVFKRKADKEKKHKKSAAKEWRATTSFPANRGEGGNAVFRAVGGFLYAIGFQTECKLLFVWRFIRDLGVFAGQLLLWVFGGLFRSLGKLLASILRDFLAPFRRVGSEFKQHRTAGPQDAGGEIAVVYATPAERQRHKVRNLLGVVLPVVSVVALVFVVYNVFGMQYALAVEVEGQTIGYVTDRAVLEDAKNILRGRLRLAKDQEMADFQFMPDLSIEKTAEFTSKDELVNRYLESTNADLTKGTELLIDGEQVAGTADGEALNQLLAEMLARHEDPEMPEAEISFVKEVECDPEQDALLLTSSIETIEELQGRIDSTVTDVSAYVARGEETLADIASQNGISLEVLRASNEAVAAEGDDYVPPAGAELVIQNERPFLQVKKTVRQKVEEAIPFETIEQETEDYTKGSRFTTQQGVEGQREACYDITYVDGELVSSVLVPEETTVLSEPVDELIMVGTSEPIAITNGTVANNFTAISGPGNYLFPVPDMLYSSRGYGGGHRGRDINAPKGTPIYACNDGVVIYAGWHYSWGNYVQIQHPDGYSTLYAHCSALFVTQGQAVSRGTPIGAIGNTGFSFGDHLHLEVWAPGGGLCDPDGFTSPPGGY